MSEDARPVRVRLTSLLGTTTATVEAGPLATDSAVVDMARREAEIPPQAFVSGEVIVA
ncbi:hypothetical protein [Haloparvum sedimenti]|uniref:hypothetical protein n=1 Tax=Haloparvum sedimenti TaxID=1678448 RepID=UPI00159EDDDD|nr:hypothetical protein [Haloparvum sedimenti]